VLTVPDCQKNSCTKNAVQFVFLRAIRKDRLRWLEHVLRMKDIHCQRLSLSANLLGTYDKHICRLEWGGCRKKRFKGNVNYLEECDEKDFE